MYSVLNPNVVYQDVSPDVTEHDIDVMSDLWEIDGRDVYRGARDPRYTHANVYWLYNEDLERVGCSEHNLKDQADFRVLWFRESEFATLLQEDGWTIGDDIWSYFPRHVFERAINEGWTTPKKLQEHCLIGPVRILTWKDVVQRPLIHRCPVCRYKSVEPFKCATEKGLLDIVDRSKVYFIDDDLVVHIPPKDSRVWFKMQQQHGDDSLQPQVPQVQVREAQSESLPLALPQSAPQSALPPPEQP